MLVWDEKFIRFKGDRFIAYAIDKGNKPVQCTPIIFDDEKHCGVGIIAGDEILRWGLFAPRDYVASWRAGEILRVLGHINPSTVRGAFFAASRSLNSKEEGGYTAPVIEGIGRDTYSKIMSLPVPEKVIRVLLDDRKRKGLKPNLYPLTEEMEMGTLAWRDEFPEAGVLTSGQYRANKKKYEEIIAETKHYLYSIIGTISIDRMDMGAYEIRNILVMLFEKKANEKYPPYVLVALATIMSDATVAQMNSYESFRMLEKVCQWVSRTSGYPRINLFGIMPRKEGSLSPQESSDLLQKLTSRYFPVEKNLMGL